MVSNESSYHPDYDAITIHVSKDSSDADVTKWVINWRFTNEEDDLDVKFKIIKDL